MISESAVMSGIGTPFAKTMKSASSHPASFCFNYMRIAFSSTTLMRASIEFEAHEQVFSHQGTSRLTEMAAMTCSCATTSRSSHFLHPPASRNQLGSNDTFPRTQMPLCVPFPSRKFSPVARLAHGTSLTTKPTTRLPEGVTSVYPYA